MTLKQFFKKIWALIVVMIIFISSIIAFVGALGEPKLMIFTLVWFFVLIIFHKQIGLYVGSQFQTLSQ